MRDWFEVGKTASVEIRELGEGRVRLTLVSGESSVEGRREGGGLIHLSNGWRVRIERTRLAPVNDRRRQRGDPIIAPALQVGVMVVLAWEGIPAAAVAA